VTVSRDLFERLGALPASDQRDAMYAVCRDDLAVFCAYYFPERFSSPFNLMHLDFLERGKAPWGERARQAKIADAAPRGGAKSTIESFASLAHDAVYGLELYTTVISTTYDLSEDLVKDLHAVFTDPEGYAELHADYGPIRVTGSKTDFVVHIPGQDARGARFKAFSFGGSIRGTKHKGVRPSKVVIDDGEHPEKVRSPGQRAKTWDYLTKDILKAGARHTVFRVVGTVLHPASMLADLLKSPAWRSTRWRSIIEWPDRMDLWQDCRRIWADLTDEDREETARTFYRRHRADMDAGAVVLWPEEEPLYDLMVLLWSDGAASFNSEKQNEPRDPTRQLFDVDGFQQCKWDGLSTITTAEGRVVNLRACKVRIWLDPRASDEIERNDYAAIAVVVEDPHGYRFVIMCQMRRSTPAQQRADVWAVWQRFHHLDDVRVGYEDNGFQALNDEGFSRDKSERRRAQKPWKLPLKGYTSTVNKDDRIAALEPDVINGWIQFDEALPPEVTDQFRDFPGGAHDDGPDAIERARWLLSGQMGILTISGLGG
jgi:predicted phage terminase large subunit-like protein